jgi:quinol monooxygenase YgiN
VAGTWARIVLLDAVMVIGTLRFLPPPSRRLEVLEILRYLQGPAETEPGCEGFRIYEDHGPEPGIVLVERWGSEAALESHIRSDAFRSIVAALELSRCPPDVRFDHVSATEAEELIERVRLGRGGPDSVNSSERTAR